MIKFTYVCIVLNVCIDVCMHIDSEISLNLDSNTLSLIHTSTLVHKHEFINTNSSSKILYESSKIFYCFLFNKYLLSTCYMP